MVRRQVINTFFTLFLFLVCLAGTVAASASEPLQQAPAYVVQKDGFTAKIPQVLARDTRYAKGADRINSALRVLADEACQAYESNPIRAGFSRTITGEITYSSPKILSLLIYDSVYYKDAAHPLTGVAGYTFRLPAGKRVDWQQLVREEDRQFMTLPALNRQMRLQIMTGRFQTYADFQGLTELPAVFYVDEQGRIVFLFQQYAVGPYAAGFCPFHTGRQIRY